MKFLLTVFILYLGLIVGELVRLWLRGDGVEPEYRLKTCGTSLRVPVEEAVDYVIASAPFSLRTVDEELLETWLEVWEYPPALKERVRERARQLQAEPTPAAAPVTHRHETLAKCRREQMDPKARVL